MDTELSPSAPVVVIGAGAAGLMAAAFAADGTRPVRLLESTRDGGRKILISGGGRCNVLPSRIEPAQYVTGSSPNSLKKILRSWPLAEQQRYFEQELGIALALEPETGKLFPTSNRARDVRDTLVKHARERGVDLWFEAGVVGVEPHGDHGSWRVRLADGQDILAAAVVLATGGLSVPKTGSDGTGLRLLRALGHTIHTPYPALTPLTADPAVHAHLAGVSLTVELEGPTDSGRFRTQGGFLFTHRGYSGPSVLNISHLAVQSQTADGPRQPIHVQWTERDASAWERLFIQSPSGGVATLLRRELPTRLADTLLEECGVAADRDVSQLRRAERDRLVASLARYPLPWTGDEGYKKAEVTGGGVSLGEVDPRTLESRLHPGLFLCGELLDAFGPIGGYNFAWAWATGRLAGRGAAVHRGPDTT